MRFRLFLLLLPGLLSAQSLADFEKKVTQFTLPNGLAFSPDESVLYIDDSARKHIRAFAVRPDGALTNGRVLLDMASEDLGVPDGLKVDRAGNVFCTGPGGVWVNREP